MYSASPSPRAARPPRVKRRPRAARPRLAERRPRAARPRLAERRPRAARIGETARFLGSGLLMGAADVVPGISGGTVALVLGIYRRLIAAIRDAVGGLKPLTKGDFRGLFASLRSLDFALVVPLGVGILLAVAFLAGPIETQLHNNPQEIAGVFFGLIVGSIFVAWRLVAAPKPIHFVTLGIIGALGFVGLGFQSGPVVDPGWVVIFGAGALGICAMILPGISGSFILLIIGMYAAIIGAVSDRDLAILVVFAAGAAVGLALFSQALGWVLERYHDLVTAAMIGLMIASLRILWPWPNGVGVVSDTPGEVVNGSLLGWPTSTEIMGPVLGALIAGLAVWGLAKAGEKLAKPS